MGDDVPLGNDIQLVVQVQEPGGGFTCKAYGGLPLTNPVLIVFAHAGSAAARTDMDQLAVRFLAELLATTGGTRVDSPGPAAGRSGLCRAVEEADCGKLLVLVGDAVTPITAESLPILPLWTMGDETFTILPVLPKASRASILSLLPAGASEQNACFWTAGAEEALPAVLAAAAITPAQPKIFISYRQVDSAELAIQLFDGLSHDGFDVFLDHFRIPPGVNFQARLTEELGDKSMVLVIESQRLLESQWVLYEINVAKTCGLGVLALNLASAPQVRGIDEGVRERLTAADFEDGKLGGPLGADAADRVRALVRAKHDKAAIHRRLHLERSFDRAVRRAGAPPPVRDVNGAFRVSAPAKDYLTWLTIRPPDLPDFHYVHGAARRPVVGVIIGLSRLMEPPRARRNEWLAGLCDLKVIDEGRLVWAATEMAAGRL